MKNDDIQHIDLTERLTSLEQLPGPRTARPRADAVVIPINEAPGMRLPVPRRSRVFLRGGGGHGVFAELTLTAPRTRSARD